MRSIVITGAGSGIGAAAAQELSKDKSIRLILIGRREESLLATKNTVANSEQHIILPTDISDQQNFSKAIHSIHPQKLNIFGLFANAGIGGENHYGKGDRWNEIINTNITGTYTTIMEILPYLKNSTEEYKNILITSSCLARFGVPNQTAYCTSKAALLGLTKALAVELAPEKILVNSILPGWVETGMAQDSIQNLATRQNISYQDSFQQQMNFVPTGKMSQPEELGKFINFLLTNQQTSITGQSLDINNGSFMI